MVKKTSGERYERSTLNGTKNRGKSMEKIESIGKVMGKWHCDGQRDTDEDSVDTVHTAGNCCSGRRCQLDSSRCCGHQCSTKCNVRECRCRGEEFDERSSRKRFVVVDGVGNGHEPVRINDNRKTYDKIMKGLARSTRDMNKIVKRFNADNDVNAIGNLRRAMNEYQQVVLLSIETIKIFTFDRSADVVRSKCGRRDCHSHEMLEIYDRLHLIVTEMGCVSAAFENASSDDECSTKAVVHCPCEERSKKSSCKRSVDGKDKRVPRKPVGNGVKTNDLKNKFVRSTEKVMKVLGDLNIDERKCDVNAIANKMYTMIKNQAELLSLVGKGPPQTDCFKHFESVESVYTDTGHCANNLAAKIQCDSRSSSEHSSVVCTADETPAQPILETEPFIASIYLDNHTKDNVIGPDQVEEDKNKAVSNSVNLRTNNVKSTSDKKTQPPNNIKKKKHCLKY